MSAADFNYLFDQAPPVAQISDPDADVRPKTPPQKGDPQSKWMNWSKNRRRSYQERLVVELSYFSVFLRDVFLDAPSVRLSKV